MVDNTFYVWLNRAEEPILWKPWEEPSAPAYFNGVATSLASALKVSGLTFYFTYSTQTLPRYGKDVVAIVLGDESCRVPKYFHKVRAIFKCYGTNLARGQVSDRRSYYNLVTTIQFIMTWFRRLPSIVHYYLQHVRAAVFKKRLPRNIYDIPLGYANQLDLPIKRINDRYYDISFLGSIQHAPYRFWSPKLWLGTPKSISRRQMIAALKRLQTEHPQLRVGLTFTSNFRASRAADVRVYSEQLMSTKICLVPRGASLETYRFFEAMRYGCTVIAEALPSRWFYDESPAVHVTEWGALSQLVPQLLDDGALEKNHHEALEWWRTKCSEESVGAYIANILNRGGATA